MLKPIFSVKTEKETAGYARFVVEPLEPGYGQTLGNSLRRILLTSTVGAAVTKIKVDGVRHRFSTLEGLSEDMIDFILNVKKIRLSYTGNKPAKLVLDKKGPGEVCAKDLKIPATVKIANGDLVLGNLADKKSRLKADLWVESGVGYLPAENREASKVMGEIPVDASFSPVLNVSYQIEKTRVGRRVDLDRLILEVKTDETVAPADAFHQAAEILVAYFRQIVNPQAAPEKEEIVSVGHSEVINLTVEELNLPTRIANALRKGGFGTVGELIKADPALLGKVKNLGEKSIKVVNAALAEKGVALKEA